MDLTVRFRAGRFGWVDLTGWKLAGGSEGCIRVGGSQCVEN